jgi:hypothetical protein
MEYVWNWASVWIRLFLTHCFNWERRKREGMKRRKEEVIYYGTQVHQYGNKILTIKLILCQ